MTYMEAEPSPLRIRRACLSLDMATSSEKGQPAASGASGAKLICPRWQTPGTDPSSRGFCGCKAAA